MKTYTVVGHDMDAMNTWMVTVEAKDVKEAMIKAVNELGESHVDLDDIEISYVFEGEPCDVSMTDMEDAFE